MVRTRFTALLLALLLAFSLSACSDSAGSEPAAEVESAAVMQSEPAAQDAAAAVPIDRRERRVQPLGNGEDTVTVMIYVCGSDLESDGGAATADINEMEYADLSDNVNVVLETGGASEWQNSVIDAETNQRWLVSGGGLEALGDVGRQDMTDPNTLTSFIQFCAEEYPANRNILVFWDHGGGTIGGYGSDEHFPDTTMSLAQIDEALSGVGVTFDWIGFDCCLMGTVETAFVAEQYADYLIASQRSEPGGGWYYTDWLNAISENTSISTEELGTIIVDSFIREEQNGDYGDELTLSMIDLSAFPAFMDALYAYLSGVNTELIDTAAYKQVSQARYDSRSPGEEDWDQVDLAYLVDNIGMEGSEQVLSLLDQSVLHNGQTIENYSGLSLYFPYASIDSVGDTLDIAKSIGLAEPYQKFMGDFASLMAGGQIYNNGGSSNPLVSDTASAAEEENVTDASWLDSDLVSDYESYYAENQYDASDLAIVEQDGGYVLQMSPEDWDLITDVYLEVYLDAGDGYIHLGSDDVAEYNDEGDLLVQFDSNTWVALDGHIVSYFAEHSDEENVWKGYVPALVNDEEARLIVVWNGDEASVVGYEKVYGSNTAARGLLALEDGDEIQFISDYYTYDGEYEDQYVTDSLVVDGAIAVTYEDVGESDCLVYYSLHDIYENVFWTEPVLYTAE